MKVLNKDRILTIITEELRSREMGEMAHKLALKWPNRQKLENYKEFHPEPPFADMVASKNPETGEIERGVVYSNKLRSTMDGYEIYQFTNEKDPGGGYYDPNSGRYTKYIPRSLKAGTQYGGPERDQYKDVDPENYDRRLNIDNENSSKRVSYKVINKFFSQPKIKLILYKSGLPMIAAGVDYTESTQLVNRKMNYNGPLLNFGFNTVRDEHSIQTAFDKVIEYLEREDELDISDFKAKKHTRAFGGNSYPGGKWGKEQRTDSEKYHELTDILKLHKQAVQGGEVSYSVSSDLSVVGSIEDGLYNLKMSLIFERSVREITASRGKNKGRIVEPITASVTLPLPDDSIPEDFTVSENKKFFINLFTLTTDKITEQVLNIDPMQALPDLEPENIDFGDDDIGDDDLNVDDLGV